MNIRNIFERATRYAPVDTVSFLSAYNESVAWLLTLYGEKYVLTPGAVFLEADVLDDNCPVRDEYAGAVLDRILYLTAGNTDRMAMSQQSAEAAYRTVWRKGAYGKVVNIRATNDPYSARRLRVRRREDRDV